VPSVARGGVSMARWRCWGATCGYQAKNPVALVVIEDLDKYNYGTMGITMGITMGESFVGYFAIYKWDINILLVVWNMNFIFFYFSHSVGNVIIPTDFHIFQRGGSTTNQITMGITMGL
jgi:hypothetical protein